MPSFGIQWNHLIFFMDDAIELLEMHKGMINLKQGD